MPHIAGNTNYTPTFSSASRCFLASRWRLRLLSSTRIESPTLRGYATIWPRKGEMKDNVGIAHIGCETISPRCDFINACLWAHLCGTFLLEAEVVLGLELVGSRQGLVVFAHIDLIGRVFAAQLLRRRESAG